MRRDKETGPLARGGRALSRAREWIPFSNLGLALGTAAAATYWGFAKPHADYALALVSLLAMGLVGLAVAGVLFGALLLRRALRRVGDDPTDIQFEAVRGFARGLSMPGWRALPMIELDWRWETPAGFEVELSRARGRIHEGVSAPERAHAERVARRFVLEDGFGLARWVVRRSQPTTLRVQPYLGRLDHVPLLESMVAGDAVSHPRGRPAGDRVDMRRYVAGDPLRLVLWKVFARSRQLMVRTPERALSPSVRVLAYLVAGPGDEAAAAAARWALERGVLGAQWAFGVDGAPTPESKVPEALERVMASKNVAAVDAEGAGLQAFLGAAPDVAQAQVLVFAPGRSGPWVERVARAASAHRNLTCILAVDGILDTPRERTLARRVADALVVAPPEDGTAQTLADLESLGALARALRGAGAEVVGLDRAAGRVLPLGSGARAGGRAA